jgi:UBX domain-containing protein 6
MKIKEFLYDQLEEERGLTACLIIHTCNKNREKVCFCFILWFIAYVLQVKTKF